jgi:hypothetical protein
MKLSVLFWFCQCVKIFWVEIKMPIARLKFRGIITSRNVTVVGYVHISPHVYYFFGAYCCCKVSGILPVEGCLNVVSKLEAVDGYWCYDLSMFVSRFLIISSCTG